MRKCYSAPCRFFADDISRPNRINWYFVPDDSLIYDQPTVFTPRIDDSDVTNDSLSEPTAVRTKDRKYNSGINRWGTTGLHVDGDAQDFLGQSPRAKFSPDGRPIENPCGLPTRDVHGLRWNETAPPDDGIAPTDKHGLQLGNTDYNPYDVHGLLFGSIDIDLWTKPALNRAGLQLGIRDLDVWTLPEKNRNGLLCGSVDLAIDLSDKHGLELGTFSLDMPDIHGLKLGSVDIDAGESSDKHGLQLGSVDVEIPIDRHGLELGNVDIDDSTAEAHGLELGSVDIDGSTAEAHGLELGSVDHDASPPPSLTYSGSNTAFSFTLVMDVTPTGVTPGMTVVGPGVAPGTHVNTVVGLNIGVSIAVITAHMHVNFTFS